MNYPAFSQILRAPTRGWLALKSWLKWVFFKETDTSLRETLEELIEDAEETEASIESDERALLGNVLNLRDLTAQDVMIPRSEIIAVSINIDAKELLHIFAESGLSAVLVYRNTLDDVLGSVHIKDILAWQLNGAKEALSRLVRELVFVAPTMRTLDLLWKMRESGTRMALVVDEYGGIDGLVTFSNIIEEIIGDIQSAGDQLPSDVLLERRDGSAIVDARIPLQEFSESLGINLIPHEAEDDIDTLGGLIVSQVGRIPLKGELIKHQAGVEFEILEADPRRIKRVRVRGLNKSFSV